MNTSYPQAALAVKPAGTTLPALSHELASFYRWIHRWYGQTGEVNPSTGYFAHKQGVTERTIYRRLSKLRALGYLTAEVIEGVERSLVPLLPPPPVKRRPRTAPPASGVRQGRASGVKRPSRQGCIPYSDSDALGDASKTTTTTPPPPVSPPALSVPVPVVVDDRDMRQGEGETPTVSGDSPQAAVRSPCEVPAKPVPPSSGVPSVVRELVERGVKAWRATNLYRRYGEERIRRNLRYADARRDRINADTAGGYYADAVAQDYAGNAPRGTQKAQPASRSARAGTNGLPLDHASNRDVLGREQERAPRFSVVEPAGPTEQEKAAAHARRERVRLAEPERWAEIVAEAEAKLPPPIRNRPDGPAYRPALYAQIDKMLDAAEEGGG